MFVPRNEKHPQNTQNDEEIIIAWTQFCVRSGYLRLANCPWIPSLSTCIIVTAAL